MRHDLALQTAAGRDRALASPSTLSRFDNAAGRDWAWSVHEVMVETFIASFDTPPEDLTLDFDATDDERFTAGRRAASSHGYYDHYCFLPLYVFCGERLLVSYLRPSRIDGAKHAWAILGLLVKKLRQAWPEVGIVLRGDSGFCRHKMLDWCDSHGVGYIVGLAKNKRRQPVRRAVDGSGGRKASPPVATSSACSARSPTPPGPGSGHAG